VSTPGIRWKQRFCRFEIAYALLQSAIAIKELSIIV